MGTAVGYSDVAGTLGCVSTTEAGVPCSAVADLGFTLSSRSDWTCAFEQLMDGPRFKNDMAFVVEIDLADPIIDPRGVYPVNYGSGGNEVEAVVRTTNGSCQISIETAVSGTITISEYSPTLVVGTYDVMLPSGALSGAFHVVLCGLRDQPPDAFSPTECY